MCAGQAYRMVMKMVQPHASSSGRMRFSNQPSSFFNLYGSSALSRISSASCGRVIGSEEPTPAVLIASRTAERTASSVSRARSSTNTMALKREPLEPLATS